MTPADYVRIVVLPTLAELIWPVSWQRTSSTT